MENSGTSVYNLQKRTISIIKFFVISIHSDHTTANTPTLIRVNVSIGVLHVHPFSIQLPYFLAIATLGSVLMMFLKPSNTLYIDMLYLSVSALTVSGINTVKMEDTSSSQIVVSFLE
jgi:hypothetical protein